MGWEMLQDPVKSGPPRIRRKRFGADVGKFGPSENVADLYHTGAAIVSGLGPADETEINDLTRRAANLFGPSVG